MNLRRMIIILLLFSMAIGQQVYAEVKTPDLTVNAKAIVLMEPSTGKIILEQNPHEKLPLASVTKVMTMLLIYEAIDAGKINWDDKVSVSSHAASMGGSQIFLEETEQQTVLDLTKAIVIASANDAAVAMAEFIAGSEESFVEMMNKRAASLGMADTHFVNCCGLDVDNHYSSANDIAIMSRELIIKHPKIFELSTIWMDTITHKTARGEEEFGLSNTNRLIKAYSGATGLKTGSTSKAQYCISATAKRGDMQLIAVVLGAPDPKTRFGEAMRMMDFGFANYSVVLGEEVGTPKGMVKVNKGDKEQVGVEIKNQINCLVAKGNNIKVDTQLEIAESLDAPAKKGTKAGEIIYSFEGKEVGRSDLITMEEISKANVFDIMNMLFKRWLS